MSKEMLVLALGVWVAVVPFLGVPGSWRTVFLLLTGAALAGLGFFLRADALSRGSRRTLHHPFVENGDSADAYHEHHGKEEKEKLTSLN